MKLTKKFLKLQDIVEITGRTKSTIYRWIEEDKFPRPYYLNKTATSHSCGWADDEVKQWIESVKINNKKNKNHFLSK